MDRFVVPFKCAIVSSPSLESCLRVVLPEKVLGENATENAISPPVTDSPFGLPNVDIWAEIELVSPPRSLSIVERALQQLVRNRGDFGKRPDLDTP
jgi:hypothetical protein